VIAGCLCSGERREYHGERVVYADQPEFDRPVEPRSIPEVQIAPDRVVAAGDGAETHGTARGTDTEGRTL
jgi:hypothetical protein